METITIKTSPAAVQKLGEILEQEVASMGNSLAEKQRDLDGLKSQIRGEDTAALPLSVEKSPLGRARKGETEKVILAFLASNRGSGWTQAQICERTGVSTTTASRVLNRIALTGKAIKLNDAWRLPA